MAHVDYYLARFGRQTPPPQLVEKILQRFRQIATPGSDEPPLGRLKLTSTSWGKDPKEHRRVRERLEAELDAIDPEWRRYYHLHPRSEVAWLKPPE